MMDNEQLPKGYKNTEVGLIPEDWEVKPIGTFTAISVGRDLKESNFSTYQDSKYQYPVFSNTVSDFGLYGYYDVAEYFGESLTIVGRGVGLGTAFARKGGFGAIGRLLVLFPENNIDVNFLTEYINHRVKIFSESGGIPQLTGVSISKYRIPLPPTKAEQTAIATALSDADALINSLSTLIAKKRNIKQGAMQQLLKPKDGWEVKKLGDFLDYEQPTEYLVTDTEYNDNNQIPVLTAGKTFILGYTNEEHGIFKNLPVIIFDDFTTAIKYVDFPFKAKSSAMKMLLPKNEKVNLRLIYEIMLQIKYQVADHKRHWIGEYSKIEIKVPSTPEEQNEIATILSDMDAEIQALESKLEKYRKIKLGMMQNLLTGKIRLV
ncbi:MAG: restriction endonuclease subunit S [Bacteroidales bacterium]|nr:restriction endonuclease subunit S [Bacteroidales bacterium]